MKTFVVVCLAILAVASALYTDRYDNLDMVEILSNCKLAVPHIKCIIGESKKCTPEGLELKQHITDALQNKCSECTEKQKEKAKFTIGVLVNCQKPAWEKIRAIYDPKNTYYNQYKKEYDEAAAAGDCAQYTQCDI